MKIVRTLLILSLLLPAISIAQTPAPAKSVKAVKFGHLWDAHGKLWTNAIVLIEDDKIKSVTTNPSDIPPHAQIINPGEMLAPRMFVCGYGLTATSTPYKPGLNPPLGGIADGVPEVLRAVRQQVAAGADVIKLYASTGTDDDVTQFQTYSYDEIKDAVAAAHQFRKKIAIHSYGPDAARDAVRASTDSL